MSWIDRLRQRLGKVRFQEEDFSNLSCDEVAEFLLDYVDDDLDEDQRRLIHGEIKACCCSCERALLMEVAFTDCIKGAFKDRRAPTELRQRILEKLTP